MSVGYWQILLILLVVLLLFGAGKIPRLMGDMAKGINAFKKGMSEGDAASSGDSALETGHRDAKTCADKDTRAS